MDASKERKLHALGAIVRVAQEEIERGCPNATDDDLSVLIDEMNRMFAPKREKPIGMYTLRNLLGGIKRETVQRKIKGGALPKGFQIPGEGNKNFWFKSEVLKFLKKK